ncbi:Alpha/Beta hydrolase protein [Cladochytrium replicatum]|nr:Alpha/Beta hydrolase protein [Cladochytrium replicatum]
MIHGILGWAAPILGKIHYYGGLTGNFPQHLRDQGYPVIVPAVGPLSSNWERACELYAQLRGSRVDYGAARAAKFGHARYGRDYTGKASYHVDFGTNPALKVNLIGHSQGGPTMRTLAALFEQGSAEEVAAAAAAGTLANPLFYTNKTFNPVHSAFAITPVLQGTTAESIVSEMAKFVVDIAQLLVGAGNVLPGLWDWQLTHWGLDHRPGESFVAYIARIFASPWNASKSNAQWDNSILAFRDPLTTWIQNSANVYYFSLPARATFDSLLSSNELPYADTSPFLWPTATVMGRYTNTALFGSDSAAWRSNDGLVPIKSQMSDAAGGYDTWLMRDIREKSVSVPATLPRKGKFQYVGTADHQDHIRILGWLDVDVLSDMEQLYENIAGLLWSLPA